MLNSTIDSALSVAGLTDYIKLLLEEDAQLQQIWIWGEVTSVKDHRSGLFFTLTDPEQAAAINCVVWGGLRKQLRDWPEVGERVAALGSLSLYAKRGDYRFKTLQVRNLGEGLQALQLQQLRSRLAAEGLFDPLEKRSLPPNPQTIAVITSPTAAAWGDIQHTLQARQPGLHVLLSPATVQGNQAPASIVEAFERIEQDDRAEVIILARGGGATEDLDCFNSEQVVRAIYHAQRPVITGIGHERDQSLADLVADVAVHTPTAAAERVVPDQQQLHREHLQRKTQLIRLVAQHLAEAQLQLEDLKTRLRKLPTGARSLQMAHQRQQVLTAKLQALDPHAVMQRGYAVVNQADGAVVTEGDRLTPGQTLTLTFAQGQVTVVVQEVQAQNRQNGEQTSTMEQQ